MSRIFLSLLVVVSSFQFSFAKLVDEQSAKTAGYNFCKSQGINAGELSLAYTAASTVGGARVVDFYVFNTGSNGFVMISADDRVVPVLGFSTESSFRAGYLPSSIADWFDNYSRQINYVIANGLTAAPKVSSQWTSLMSDVKTLSKTTVTIVPPMMKTAWNQSPNYNYLCPFDYTADTNVVTGCVATAMAQVMKFWNWPRRGEGMHSYNAGTYGMLSADFGGTVYQWDSMPNYVATNNPAVGTLMLQAGVSVNMSYGVTESGASVMNYGNPSVSCTQNALPAYFGYKATLQGLFKSSYNDSDWVDILKTELNAGRPVIYSGYGNDGGHCFITDGYLTNSRFHFNWGWGGYANGYFIVESLTPANSSFNDGQAIITGIEPDSSVVAGVKEVNPVQGVTVYPNPAHDVANIGLNGIKATQVRLLNAEGREVLIKKIPVNSAVVTISLSMLPAGVFFAEVQTDGGLVTAKLVIEK